MRKKVNKTFTVYSGFEEALAALRQKRLPGKYLFYIQIDEEWFKIGWTKDPVETLRVYKIRLEGTDEEPLHKIGVVVILGPNDHCEASCKIVVGLLGFRIKNKKTKHERDDLTMPNTRNTFKITQEKCESMLIRNL